MCESNMITFDSVDRVLKRTHSRISSRIPLDMLRMSLRQEYSIEDAIEYMVVDLDRMSYCESLQPKYHEFRVETPLNWWEHFKQDYAPEWFKRRYPVRMNIVSESIDLSFEVHYPFFSPANKMEYVVVREIKVTR